MEKTLIEQAKKRCKHCFALIDKEGRWWCDEGNCLIEEIIKCNEWTNSKVGKL